LQYHIECGVGGIFRHRDAANGGVAEGGFDWAGLDYDHVDAEAFYLETQTYNLPVVYPGQANVQESVGKLAPEAGYLLTAAFPNLTLDQADQILTETEGPGGGFLDNGSSFGVYSRLNLYAAAGRAAVLASGQSSQAARAIPSSPTGISPHN